jgi:hypothetical protein
MEKLLPGTSRAADRFVRTTYLLDDRGALRLLMAREDEMPMDSRFWLVSDSFGLGISTGNSYVQDGCRVIEH